ncbi:MAG: ABC-F family ATP-binding cassette domain-containing protein [Anaerolineae bacterium]
MNLVSLENVLKQFSERVLLEGVNLRINAGDRIGLIGLNGSGKTTLLRIIAGEEPVDAGSVTVWGGVRVQYLPQEPRLDGDLTVLDYIFQSDAPHIRLLREYEQASQCLAQDPENALWQERLTALGAEMDRTGAWAAEAGAKTILTRLGITTFEARLHTLSGGQRKRVALAGALIDRADLLILDEPTNHIDAGTIAWLEAYLEATPGALLMVTHDRYLLERVVNRIVELDRRKLVNYPGSYRRYLQRRTARHEQLAAAEARRQGLLRRELAWLHRSPKARGTKQKARKQRLAELQRLRYDQGQERVAMTLAGRRLGKQVLEAANLSKAYGPLQLFRQLDFTLHPGDRIGIIGPNGAGKSTFLDILAGKTKPDSGAVRWGETVQLGYFDQGSGGLRDDQRVIDFIEAEAPLIRARDGTLMAAAQILEWFLFSRPEQRTKIGSLSGGERRRLYLLRTLVHRPNVLFLDEPTNDLDVQTLTVLEEFLDHFSGCLLVVSHDRYFLDRNVDYLMSFEDGVLGTRYPTPFETYRRLRAAAQPVNLAASPQPQKPTKRRPVASRLRRLSWKEQRELERLEERIGRLETAVQALEAEINAAGSDYLRLQALAEKLQRAQADLEAAEERWLELSELAESAG